AFVGGSAIIGQNDVRGVIREFRGVTSIKLDMHEYKQMNLAVGDKVFVELTKAENLGV
ncbi:MAG: hypothetical protein JRZ95_04825, partial [Nitrososphaerota archaeon]|nr:hypothetical protein [Nitrososphaerota archaeon]